MDIPGIPLWMFFVGPPGSAKTVLIQSLREWKRCYSTSSLTSHALISGSTQGEGGDPSLIPKLADMMLAIKDFTPVLEMRDTDQSEIVSTLRDAYDGSCGKTFGNGVERRYVVKFSIVSGVTPAIYVKSETHSGMGERFVKFMIGDNLTHHAEQEIIARAIHNVDDSKLMTDEIADVTCRVLRSPRSAMPTIPPHVTERLIAAAQYGAYLRGTVTRDFRGENVQGRPFRESGTRLGMQVSKATRGLAWIRGKAEAGEEELRVALKIIQDTVAQRYDDLIRFLWVNANALPDHPTDGPASIGAIEIAKRTHYPQSTVKRMLDDMALLGVCVHTTSKYKHQWRLSPEIAELIRRSGVYADPAVATRPPGLRVRIRRRRAPGAPPLPPD
jgi:hypothetical protein